MDTSKYFAYSDLTNTFEVSADSINTNIMNASVINTGDLNVVGTLNLSSLAKDKFAYIDLSGNVTTKEITGQLNKILIDNSLNNLTISLNPDLSLNNVDISNNFKINSLSNNSFIGTDGSKNIVDKLINGTSNQINIINNSNGITLSTPQDISTISNVVFNNITSNGTITNSTLATNSIVATDNTKALINRTLAGTNNQISINTVGTTTTFSTPQDIATTSNVTFNNIINNGSLTCNTLSANSIVATDGSKQLTNRTLAGTTNQISINTVGTTTTFSTPQNIHTGATPTFAGIITDSLESSGNTLNIASNNTTQNINIGSGSGLQTVNIGSSGSGVTTINIGAGGDIVNIAGSLNYISTTNLDISDNLITINKGSNGTGTARGAGINIRDASNDSQGYITVGSSGNTFTLKAPENSFVLSTPILTGTSSIVTTNETQTINGNKTLSGTVNMSALTASTYLGLDSGKNIISLSDPASNLLSSNNTWSGNNTWNGTGTVNGAFTYWGSTFYYNDVEIIGAGSTNKLVMTNGTKKIVSSSYGESDLVLRSTNQTIAGVKTFTNNPIISPGVGIGGELFIRGNNETGFSIFSTNNTNGLQVWSTALSTTILNIRNALTAGRLLTTDSNNYLASASVGASDLVLTSTNQTIAGNKTFSGQIVTGKYIRAYGILANPFNINSNVTSALQYNDVLSAGIGVTGNSTFSTTTAGTYLVTWTVRVTVATVWEVSTWIELGSDTSFKYGLTSIPPGSQYASSSVIINCGVDTLRVMVYNGRSDAATVRLTNTNDNQLYIKYIGTN